MKRELMQAFKSDRLVTAGAIVGTTAMLLMMSVAGWQAVVNFEHSGALLLVAMAAIGVAAATGAQLLPALQKVQKKAPLP